MSITIRLTVALALAAMIALAGCSSQSSAERDFQNLVGKVEKVNVDLRKKQESLMEQVRKFNQKYPQMQIDTLAQQAYGLTGEEAQILATRIQQEKDISTKGLLNEIVALNKQLEDVKKEMEEYAKQLPPPHVVTRGESHFQVCLEYLTKEAGFSKDSAMKALERVAQFDEMMPGFYVWHFIDRKTGNYLTTVTQGEAKISPNQLRRATKRKLEQERQALVQAKADLESQVAELEKRKAMLIGQIENVGKERDQVRAEAAKLGQEKQALATEKEQLTTKVNSVYYSVGNLDDLKKKGVLKRPFLGKVKGSDLSKVEYDKSMDVTKSKTITLTAAQVGLKVIKSVSIFPAEAFTLDGDYSVKVDGGSATITLLKPDRFKGANIVIAAK